MLHVRRIFPTIVDMLADFGGVAEVIFFIVYMVITVHHNIMMQLFLVNEAVLQRDDTSISHKKTKGSIMALNDTTERVTLQEDKEFGYWEVGRFEYGCHGKKHVRAKRYRSLMKVVAERMDVCSIVTNSGYANLISNLLLEPYQMKMFTQYKAEEGKTKKSAKDITLNDSAAELLTNLEIKQGDEVQLGIDAFLAKLLEQTKEGKAIR